MSRRTLRVEPDLAGSHLLRARSMDNGSGQTLAVAGRKGRALVQTRQLKASKRNDITCA